MHNQVQLLSFVYYAFPFLDLADIQAPYNFYNIRVC